MPTSRTYFIVSAAVLAAASIIFDMIPLPRAPWGMKIDFVGTVWVLSYFLYGLSHALVVSVIATLYILLFSSTGYVGAVMKFIATVPMFLVPAAFAMVPSLSKRGRGLFRSPLVITAVAIVASVVRLLVAAAANLYWAIPIFYNMTPEQALQWFGGLIPLFVFVAGFNVVQGIVDIYVSWFIALKLGVADRFGSRQTQAVTTARR